MIWEHLGDNRLKSIEERFWPKVFLATSSNACWNWTAAKNDLGYGIIGKGRRGEGNLRAHRVSWKIKYGRLPRKPVLHACDNPSCVNPAHLFLGTLRDNSADMWAKRRGILPEPMRGETHPLSKLTWRKVGEIRRTYRTGGVSLQELADEFGVSKKLILNVVKRRTWKVVEGVSAP